MKIIHVVLGKANPNRMNGVNKVAHNLATIQKKLSIDVEIIGLTNTPELEKIERNYNIYFFERKKIKMDFRLKKYLLKLNSKKTLVHLHGGFIIDFYFIARFLKKLNIKYIFTSHGCYNKAAMKKKYLLKKLFFVFFDVSILKNAWKVQFLGKSEFHHIDKLVSSINKILVPNGQDINDLKFTKFNIPKIKRPVFGFVGRIDIYHKGLDILLEGFLNYKNSGGLGVLWIIGDGIDFKGLIKKYSSNEIVFYGSKFGNQKLNLISNMDAFIHTSRFEGFPMALLEAAGLGLPLIVSEGTNFGNYVKKFNSGLVISKNNQREVQRLLFLFEDLYNKNDHKLISDNSKKMIKKEFDWTIISNKLISGFSAKND